MEYGSSWDYYTLVNELTQGMEQAKQLRVHLSSGYMEPQDLLLQRILSSYEKALSILKWNGGGSVGQSQPTPLASGAPESSISVEGSPQNEEAKNNFNDYQDLRDVSKKRKTQPTWTEQVRVSPENGLEGPADDGYSWRKYGQKDILGAKYPRSYYRCTYRHMRNCWATKQVQRSDDDPTLFEITYKGTHVCNTGTSISVPQHPSPAKQEFKHSYNHNNHQQPQQPNQILMNFRANLRVNTGDSEAKEIVSPFSFPSATHMDDESQLFPMSALVDENILGTYSPSFVSPATSGSNYFSMSPCHMANLGRIKNLHSSESDLTEIISATASATNSPIAGLDFSIDSVELDPNFPFNAPGFFT
ncbi:probable WRKY transcription factor 53 [Coffea arabica]|uniref:Probable WRKY transcription factor 53 n=1 Tax=Coffea arabica TaxID=13443 RepID=A0A6P6U616_COFAR|nr:probable WRKY transcription factor 41 [Coffea arabica]XP_027085591.1 probable WRKY transcription factor 41 [Coffea arabica]